MVDWFRILAELHKAGVNNSEVARIIDCDRATVRRWKCGTEPKHSDGVALLNLHARVTALEPAK